MKIPSLNRTNALLGFILLSIGLLYVGRTFLIPLAFAGILTLLLMPVSNRLERWGISRIWATFLCVLLFLAFVAVFVGIIYAQAASFQQDWPQIQQKFQQGFAQLQQYVQQRTGVGPEQQLTYLKEQLPKLGSSSGATLKAVLGGLGGIVAGLTLVTLYLFFILWKREMYRNFILKLTPADSRAEVAHALRQISEVAAQYVVGRLISLAFLAICYSIGFSIVGLENAILVSLVAVLPTLIPYVGAFVGGAFPLFMALISGSPDMVAPTLAIMVGAQVIDNNIIEPLVMGSELDLSPIFTIIAIVLGELLWGIPGMILFEPIFAIIRIVCAHVPSLHPYRYLLENEVEEPKWIGKLKRVFS